MFLFQRPEYLTAVPASSMTERQEGDGDNRVEGADNKEEGGGESIREEEGGVKGKGGDTEDMEDEQIFYNNNIENGNKVGLNKFYEVLESVTS